MKGMSMGTYGVFALSGPTVAIIAIVAGTLTVVASIVINGFKAHPAFGMVGVVVAFVLCAVLVATIWTLPGIWGGFIFTLIGGILVLALPFTALIKWG